MVDERAEGRSRAAVVAYLAWWLALGLWSYGLLSPVAPRLGAAVIPSGWTFLASKVLHFSSFAFLAATAALLPIGIRHRAALCLLVATHAALTEYLQTFVPGRFGCVQDVCINLGGVTLGLALARWWRRREVRPTDRPISATTTAT